MERRGEGFFEVCNESSFGKTGRGMRWLTVSRGRGPNRVTYDPVWGVAVVVGTRATGFEPYWFIFVLVEGSLTNAFASLHLVSFGTNKTEFTTNDLSYFFCKHAKKLRYCI